MDETNRAEPVVEPASEQERNFAKLRTLHKQELRLREHREKELAEIQAQHKATQEQLRKLQEEHAAIREQARIAELQRGLAASLPEGDEEYVSVKQLRELNKQSAELQAATMQRLERERQKAELDLRESAAVKPDSIREEAKRVVREERIEEELSQLLNVYTQEQIEKEVTSDPHLVEVLSLMSDDLSKKARIAQHLRQKAESENLFVRKDNRGIRGSGFTGIGSGISGGQPPLDEALEKYRTDHNTFSVPMADRLQDPKLFRRVSEYAKATRR